MAYVPDCQTIRALLDTPPGARYASSMAPNRTVSELRKSAEVTDQEIDAAVDAYLADSKSEPFRFASGFELDVAAAVEAHQPAKAAAFDPDRSAKFKRTMVRTAILLAHPVKG